MKVMQVFTVMSFCALLTIVILRHGLYNADYNAGGSTSSTTVIKENTNGNEFINPFLRNGTVVKKNSYLQMIENLSSKQADELLFQFSIKGIQYLTSRAKREFLWCDSEVRTRVPVRNRNRVCTEMTFMRDRGRRVALASFPGSGSTWSRTLLEQATGIYTGAIYCDRRLKGEGFLGEYITSGNVIAIKTHSAQGPKQKYEAAIFLIRNISNTMKSEINRRSSARNHTGVIDAAQYDKNDPTWQQFVSDYSERYVKMTNSWLNSKGTKIPTIVVRYEDLVKDTRTQLQRMLEFLQYPYSKERLDCVVNHQVETFHRKQHMFDPFTDGQKQKFVKIMKQVEPLLNLYNTSYDDI